MMEKYYECTSRFYSKGKNPHQYLTDTPLFGKERQIPIILVDDDGNVFEFFTKTKFSSQKDRYGHNTGFALPNSTLFYSLNSSDPHSYRNIFPADALAKLEPFLKNPSKYSRKINSYFDWFRDEFVKRQQETERRNRANANAQITLSKYWKKF